MSRKQVIPSQKAKNSWLCGKVKCGECGYALIAKEYRNGRDRYLMCSQKLASKSCGGAGTLYTDEVEHLVYSEMRNRLEKFRKLSCSERTTHDAEQTALEIQLAETEREIRGASREGRGLR
jgi:ssDNA-binding Zn-finger/Zn-ribbon topoisomerase 1